MRGEFVNVWMETHREIWTPIVEEEGVSEDIYCELYRDLTKALKLRPSIQDLADILDSPLQSREAFENAVPDDFVGEPELAAFLEAAHETLEDLGGDQLANQYFNRLAAFVDKFSLRYDLRRPCVLCPTLPGVFTSLIRDLRILTRQDPNLHQLMNDHEDAVRDLRFGCTDGRIKTCIGKQFMLLEAISALDPSVTKNTLGEMCDQIVSWPHPTIRESLKKLYGFASGYPGIRHGSRTTGALRAIDMRDMVAMSVLLAGFIPYLERRLSGGAIYGAAAHASPAAQPTFVAASGSVNGNLRAPGFFVRLFDRLLHGGW